MEFDPPEGGTEGRAGGSLEGAPQDLTDPLVVLEEAERAYRKLAYERALRLYSRALGFDPNLDVAWFGQLRCLLDLDENPEARTWATKAVKSFPNHADILAARGLAEYRLGNAKDGLAYTDNALSQASAGWFVWLARGEILAGTGSQQAHFCLMKAQEMGGANDWLPMLKVAQAYRRTPFREKAIALYRKVLARETDLAEAWYELGVLLGSLGFTTEAREALTRAGKLNPIESRYVTALQDLDRFGPLTGWWQWLTGLLGRHER